MERDTYELAVCGTCLQVLANGADGMDITAEELMPVTLGVESWGTEGFHLVADGDDLGFHWDFRCGVCGDTRGGDRFRAYAMPVG